MEDRILEEDILRALGEKKKAQIKSLSTEIQSPYSTTSDTAEELKKKNLIRIEGGFASLTAEGEKKADDLLRKHIAVENYFKKTRDKDEAHRIAHISEHHISEEAIRNIEKLYALKGTREPLTRLGLHEAGVIVDITVSDSKLFERIVSMGIFIGEKVTVVGKISDNVIIKVGNKKFVVDKDIANHIMVVQNEEN